MASAHDILGVGNDATSDEIRKAYRTAVKKFHPDTYRNADGHPDPERAHTAMKSITNAFDVLTNPQPRKPDPRTGPGPTRAAEPAAPQRAHSRPASVFGHARRQREEQEAARREANEYARQARDWTGAGREDRNRTRQGEKDLEMARAGTDGHPPESRRAAELRALRQMRQSRSDPSRHETIAEEATRRTRQHLDRDNPEPGRGADALHVRTHSMFGTRRDSETATTDTQDHALDASLEMAGKQISLQRTRALRDGEQPPEAAALHKAQKISLEGRTMKIHLGSPGIEGLNLVAVPEIIRNGSEIRTGQNPRVVALRTERDGAQAPEMKDASSIVKNGGDMKVQFVFSETRQNLRENPATRTKDAQR